MHQRTFWICSQFCLYIYIYILFFVYNVKPYVKPTQSFISVAWLEFYVFQIFNMLIDIGLPIWVSLQTTQWWHHWVMRWEYKYKSICAQGVRMFVSSNYFVYGNHVTIGEERTDRQIGAIYIYIFNYKIYLTYHLLPPCCTWSPAAAAPWYSVSVQYHNRLHEYLRWHRFYPCCSWDRSEICIDNTG